MMTMKSILLLATLLAAIVTTTPVGAITNNADDILPGLLDKLRIGGGGDDDGDNPSSSWKQLGKIQLDRQEYAEAARIFRYGSALCSDDVGLKHHVQVWEAFHGKTQECSATTATTLSLPPLPPPMTGPAPSVAIGDIFLTLDCPEAPEAVKRWRGNGSDVVDNRRLLIHASKEPLLSREACRYLINAAQETAKARGGWTTDRHVHAPTCDIPAHELPLEAQTWIRNAFDNVLYELIRRAFGDQLADLDKLCMQDCFVVRYDGSSSSGSEKGPGFSDLKLHQDESLVSLTIALNDMDEYEGGGLFIAPTQDLLNGPAGTVLCFAGSLVHGGFPVTKGTRWILTAFLYPDANCSGKEPGYTLKDFPKN